MKYKVTQIATHAGGMIHHQEHTCLSGSLSIPQPTPIMSVDITVEILEPSKNMLRSLEDFEAALNGFDKIHPDAPSYQELLAKHAPEFLL